MKHELVASTRTRRTAKVVMDEREKELFTRKYGQQDAETPFRLFAATPGKPTVHLLATKEIAIDAYNMYSVPRLLMNMRTGAIIKASR